MELFKLNNIISLHYFAFLEKNVIQDRTSEADVHNMIMFRHWILINEFEVKITFDFDIRTMATGSARLDTGETLGLGMLGICEKVE